MRKDAPKISIIMPCYNAAAHLPVSIGSVLAQTFSDWELIAVDDGSTDSTLTWLRKQLDPRIHIHTQSNKGVSAARNAGLAMAKGEYVAFLDSDDTWASDFLARMLEAITSEPDIGLVYCGWQNVGVEGPRSAPFVPPDYEQPDKKAKLLAGTRWPIHACMTRLNLVSAAGGFDPRFAVGEDFLLWLEIACFHRIRLVPEVLAQYIHHGGVQATRDRVRAARQLRDVQAAFLTRHPEIIDELGRSQVKKLTDGVLLGRAYEAYWRRDLETAQPIFRMAFLGGGWKLHDLRYLLPSLLPVSLFKVIVTLADRRASGHRPS
jgi:glycosyltransferase involved in cell wall biosynthesis